MKSIPSTRKILKPEILSIRNAMAAGMFVCAATMSCAALAWPGAGNQNSSTSTTQGTQGTQDQYGSNSQTGDDDLAHKVKDKIMNNKQTKTSPINASARNGVVTLTGRADSKNAAQEAEKIARNTQGVKKVDDKIQVASAGGMQNGANPTFNNGNNYNNSANPNDNGLNNGTSNGMGNGMNNGANNGANNNGMNNGANNGTAGNDTTPGATAPRK